MKYLKAICLVFLVAFLSACSGGSSAEEKLGGGACGALRAKVFNGEECSQVARTPVVAIYSLALSGDQIVPAGICSGTLITVDDVLTSAHCLTAPIMAYGENLAGFVAVVGGEEMFFRDAAIHPYYDGTVGTPYDVAMMTLERVPNPAIGPLPVLLSQLTLPGQRMSTFGYGTNNRGEIGTLKSAEIVIEALSGGNLIATLDSGASICGGDSGGPVMQVVNGVTTIIGVNSFAVAPTDQQCAASGSQISGFVDLQNDDILDFIANYAADVTAI